MFQDWRVYSWYCINCKEEVAGMKNKKNQIRVKCPGCKSRMIRTIISRRHDVIEIYAPDESLDHDCEMRTY